MQYETAQDAAKRLNIDIKALNELAESGKIYGAIRHEEMWLIPHDFKPTLNYTRASSYDFVPLLRASFIPGKALEFIESFEDKDCRNLALAEYYYFKGDINRTCEILEPYFLNPEPTVKLAAMFIYASSSISASHIHIAEMSMEYIKEKLLQFMPENLPESIKAIYLFAQTSIDLETSFKDSDRDIKSFIQFLPQGLQFYSLYLLALQSYRSGQHQRALGIAETALIPLEKKLYPLPAIYLHIISAAALMRMKDVDSAKEHFLKAMEIAKPDKFILPFVENYKKLPGLVESCFKKDYPNDYAELLSLADIYYNGQRKIKKSDNSIVEHLTITELSIAMLAYLGWSNTEISVHMNLSENTVKRYLNIIFQKLGIRSRKELHRYLTN